MNTKQLASKQLHNTLFDTRPSQNSKGDTVDETRMDSIIDAILQGQYSKACLLLLEATDRDPLHYIPYRTYNRLQKQRQQAAQSSIKSSLADLDYLENVAEATTSVKGGSGYNFLPIWQPFPNGDRYSLIIG